MSANFSTIKAGIKAMLEADADLGEESQVFDYEPNIDQVTVDPFAVVVAAENESEFENTTDNMRIYGFIIRVFVERRTRGPAEAEALLTAIVDRLVQAFDENYTLSVDGVLFSLATPSVWQYALSEKEYRVADIRLSTKVSVDVSP